MPRLRLQKQPNFVAVVHEKIQRQYTDEHMVTQVGSSDKIASTLRAGPSLDPSSTDKFQVHPFCSLLTIDIEEEEGKMALFMKKIINFQLMISCKGELFGINWWIINLLLVSGFYKENFYIEGV